MNNDKIKREILKMIENAEETPTIKDIARATGYSRPTVSKYLALLSAEGKVSFRVVGPAKLFRMIWAEKGAKERLEKWHRELEEEVAREEQEREVKKG